VALIRADVSEERFASVIKVLVFVRSVLQLLVTSNVVPSSLIPCALMMEAIRSSDMSVLTRDTQRNIPEGDIHHSHRRENIRSSIFKFC
jgi:hypothetical protein